MTEFSSFFSYLNSKPAPTPGAGFSFAIFSNTKWLCLGAALVITGAMIGLAIISEKFYYGSDPTNHPIGLFFLLTSIAGIAYLVLFFTFTNFIGRKSFVLPLLIIGAIARLSFMGSTPIYEDDWYRYLWDGAVTSSGINPYTYTPAEANSSDPFGSKTELALDPDLTVLQNLGETQDHWPERINYPYVTTIYPPLTQVVFALAHSIGPFNIDAWRFILFFVDCISVFLILILLQRFRLKSHWALLYWLNPIVIMTTFNAAHMDILLVPFIIGTILLISRDKLRLASIPLAAAAAIKFWPIILAPIIFRKIRYNLKELIIVSVIFIISVTVLFWPMLTTIDPSNSGLSVYANTWQRNAFLFHRLENFLDGLTYDPGLIARIIIAIVSLAVIARFTFAKETRLEALPRHLFYTIIVFYFLSPTGYPWYATWVFMLLPFVPSYGAAAMTLTLPLYYSRYYLEAINQSAIFNNILVPIEFSIPILILAFEFTVKRKMKA